MQIVEKLGSFYLGKQYDLTDGKVTDIPVNYDSRDLTTHAVCLGMTGSGKTGLCIDVLEEAAIDGVPALIIDPKGDITNLLLTFPDLRPEDFRPWINIEDAERQDLTPDAYAAKIAETWRQGLAQWDQTPERIQLLKDAAEFAIYTPGSQAGSPISVLSSFRAPSLDWDTETEVLRDHIQGTVSALLGLVGVQADPLRSREHILLSNIVEHSWRAGQHLDIGALILAVQTPPFSKLGVFDLNAFFPEKDRFALAMLLNNLIASPSFAAWMMGEPLDIGALLHSDAGKPRHSVFYIAHLNDAERMFFVTILLEQLISWMRSQPGTTSLRALLYIDEVFGFFPPVNEPPSKRPILTLLKQARAFGIGVMLTTQNPADLDYKGLTNAGTWFIGKLQTERDKARLMEGLAGALAGGGDATDTRTLDKLISSLRERLFLLHNVHDGAPIVLQTRWALCYLRGPLTRQQIKLLTRERQAHAFESEVPVAPALATTVGLSDAPDETPGPAPDAASGQASAVSAASDVPTSIAPAQASITLRAAAPSLPEDLAPQPPTLPASVKQVYLPVTLTASAALQAVEDYAGMPILPGEQRLVYEPALVGLATVHFFDRKHELDTSRDVAYLLLLSEQGMIASWQSAWSAVLAPRNLDATPNAGALFPTVLPPSMEGSRSLAAVTNSFLDFLYRNQVYHLACNPSLKLCANAGETERDFRARCQLVAREARDTAVDTLSAKYEAQFKKLQEQLSHEQADLSDAQATYGTRHREEIATTVSNVVGALGLFGRRNDKRAAAAKNKQVEAAKREIAQTQAEIAGTQADMAEIRSRMQEEAGALTRQWQQAAEDIQETRIVPRKADIGIALVAVAWAASWQIGYEDAGGLTHTDTVPAYPLNEPPAG